MTELAPSYADLKEAKAEVGRLRAALQEIADYSPSSTIQPVLIARAALKYED